MESTSFWFKHETNTRNDYRIIKLSQKHGMAGIGIYWCIIEMLYEANGYLDLDTKLIAHTLRVREKIVESVIKDFNLFIINSGMFTTESTIENLKVRKEKSDKARLSINKRWDDVKRSIK